MPTSNGPLRFGLVLAVIGLALTAYYANLLRMSLSDKEKTIQTLTAERDSWKSKFDGAEQQSHQAADALKQTQSEISLLQAKADAAPPPQGQSARR